MQSGLHGPAGRRGRPIRGIVAALGLLVAVHPASAHPHVWIDALATYQLSDGRLASLKIEWIFDKLFSSILIADYDRNRNQTFDADETEKLRQEAFAELVGFGYYTHLWIGEQKIKIEAVTGFSAAIVAGRVVYRFVVPLAEPVDPKATAVAVGLYDESYYVDVRPVPDDGVRFTGAPEATCAITPEKADGGEGPAAAFGLEPRRYRLTCSGP